MQHARRQFFSRHVGWREAEHVGVANWLRAEARAERVADHTADTRVGATVGLDGARPVVRFDLEGNVVLAIEADDAGVVAKDAHAPIVGAERSANLLRRGKNRLFEQVVELPRAVLIRIGHAAGERFVAAMLTPGLGDRFQLNVGRLARQIAKVMLNGFQLDQGQAQRPFFAQSEELLVAQAANRHRHRLEAARRAEMNSLELQRTEDDLLDRIVGQQLGGQELQLRVAQPADPKFSQRDDRVGSDAEIADGGQGAGSDGISHARLRKDVNE